MQLQQNVLLAQYSTFRIGGSADYFVVIKTSSDLEALAELLKNSQYKDLPKVFLGGGSNIIFDDEGLRGLVVKLSNTWVDHLGDGVFEVGAGTPNTLLYQEAMKLGYDFSPWFTIPGSIGGAIAGNAGVPGFETGNYLKQATVINLADMSRQDLTADFFEFGYRHTVLHDHRQLRDQLLITKATVKLPKANPKDIKQSAQNALQMRKEKQPWGRTGGSFFKNPSSEQAAGYLLDQCDCKDLKIGGAYFSEKHANFVMNDGTATQKDIITLGREGKKRVAQKFGVELENEVRMIDEFGNHVVI